MKTRLTLTVDKEVVTRIKRLARERGTSVSEIFDRWARALIQQQTKRTVGPLTQKALGAIRYTGEKTDRQLIEEALLEKYSF